MLRMVECSFSAAPSQYTTNSVVTAVAATPITTSALSSEDIGILSSGRSSNWPWCRHMSAPTAAAASASAATSVVTAASVDEAGRWSDPLTK